MRVLILGGDGYLGWPQAMYLSMRGYHVAIFDNLARRHFDLEHGFHSLLPIASLHSRVQTWKEITGCPLEFFIGDTTDYEALSAAFQRFQPEAVVDFAEQRSAPYSMIDRKHAVYTQYTNVIGTLNLLYALKEFGPHAHLVKLGTMGEYGTPNIDIEEGFLEITHKGRKDILPYPKQPGSFYHLCYDDQTEVLTRAGWKLFKDLTDGDEIATRQLDDPHIVFAKPIAHTAYLYEGPMYCLEQRRIDLCVTPNHRMVTSSKRRDGTEAMRFEEAKDILGKYNRYHLTSMWEGEECATFTLPGSYWLGENEPPTPAIELPMDDWLKFLGWYIAEGTVECIPHELLSLSSRQLRILFEALMTGDGMWMDRDRHYGRYYTSSKQLADDIQELAIKLGLSATVSHQDRTEGTGWAKHAEYRVNFTKTTLFQVNQHPDDSNDWFEDYAGMVYCCEVAGDGIILVRRNGKPIWCGNSKVHDSHNIMFCCKTWGLRSTDLNQGVVYGVHTDETQLDPRLATRYDYDHIYGTALNRFCAQAAIGHPLTVHGKGGQTRGYIHIKDTMRCIELTLLNPPFEGEYRVFNQITEQFSIQELAERVAALGQTLGLSVTIDSLPNPRVEAEQHYYNATYTYLHDLGLQPHLLTDEILLGLILTALECRERIDSRFIAPTVNWRNATNKVDPRASEVQAQRKRNELLD